jgi:hypothetical protein
LTQAGSSRALERAAFGEARSNRALAHHEPGRCRRTVRRAFRVEGAETNASERAEDDASLNMVSPDYFQTFRIPL